MNDIRKKEPSLAAAWSRKALLFGTIYYLPDLLRLFPLADLVSYARISLHDQKKNLPPQVSNLLNHLPKQPLDTYTEVASGWSFFKERKLFQIPKKWYGAIVVTETTSRFIRPREFHPYKRPNLLPSQKELNLLKASTEGVLLATVYPPWLSWKEERRIQKLRKLSASKIIEERVFVLKREGFSTREISASLESNYGMVVSKSTIHRIIANHTHHTKFSTK